MKSELRLRPKRIERIPLIVWGGISFLTGCMIILALVIGVLSIALIWGFDDPSIQLNQKAIWIICSIGLILMMGGIISMKTETQERKKRKKGDYHDPTIEC